MQRSLDAGDQMIEERVAFHAEIDERCKQITSRQLELEQLWREFLAVHTEAIYVQTFFQDAAECESWINAHESVLKSYEVDDSLENVETLLKKLEDFEKSLQARQETVKGIESTAESLTASLQSGQLDTDPKSVGLSSRLNQRRATLDLTSITNPARRKSTMDLTAAPNKSGMLAHVQMLRSQKRASVANIPAIQRIRELPSPPQKRSSAPQLATEGDPESSSTSPKHSPKHSPLSPHRHLPDAPKTEALTSSFQPQASEPTIGSDEKPLDASS